MRWLILSGRYSSDSSSRWLPQELGEELCSRGHAVDLLVVDPTGRIPAGHLATKIPRLRALQVPGWERPRLKHTGVAKYLPQALRMQLDPRVQRFLVGRYDACVFTTPGVLAAGLPARLKRSGRVGATVMIMWDFFPVANVEIGALSGRGSRLLHRLEQAVVRSADAVVLMTPRGEEHLDAYFTEVPGRRTVVPPWGADTAVAAHETPRRPRFTVVWGGQIVKGRALDDLLRAAADPDVMASGIDFVIAGDGPDRKKYLDLARALGIRNAEFLGHVPREEYARMLQECHVGASLLGEMSVPSFPSKTVDYCRAGLAILAAVESGTDFGTLLESAGAGVAVPSGDHKALVRALLDLAAPEHRKRTEAMGVASRLLFETELDVRVAASRFEELVTSMLGASDALPSRGTRP